MTDEHSWCDQLAEWLADPASGDQFAHRRPVPLLRPIEFDQSTGMAVFEIPPELADVVRGDALRGLSIDLAEGMGIPVYGRPDPARPGLAATAAAYVDADRDAAAGQLLGPIVARLNAEAEAGEARRRETLRRYGQQAAIYARAYLGPPA